MLEEMPHSGLGGAVNNSSTGTPSSAAATSHSVLENRSNPGSPVGFILSRSIFRFFFFSRLRIGYPSVRSAGNVGIPV